MPIVEFDGPPSWSLDASETGESTKCPWVVAAGFIAYFLRPLTPTLWTTTTHGHGHHHYPRAFCTLPSFARIERPRWRPVELNDRHLQSHGKIGDCKQYLYFETILYITGEKFVLYQLNALELKRMKSFLILNTSTLDNVLIRLTV